MLECIPAFGPYGKYLCILRCEPLVLRDQLHDIGIVTPCQSSIGRHDDHGFLVRFSFLQERMRHLSGLCNHPGYCLIHRIKIRFGLLRILLCLGQLDRRHQLHRLGDLLRTLYALLPPFNISHRGHMIDSSILLLYIRHYLVNSSLISSIAFTSFSSISALISPLVRIASGISGYFVSTYSKSSFSNSRI